MTPSKPFLDFPNVVGPAVEVLGRSRTRVWQAIVGVFEVGALGAAGSVCNCSGVGHG